MKAIYLHASVLHADSTYFCRQEECVLLTIPHKQNPIGYYTGNMTCSVILLSKKEKDIIISHLPLKFKIKDLIFRKSFWFMKSIKTVVLLC